MAVYPPFIHSTGELMSEPPAILTLPAAVLAFLWASDRERPWWAWLAARAVLFGLTAMFRPEYLLVGGAFVVLAAVRRLGARRGWQPRPRRAPAAAGRGAAALPIVPWTIRNYVVLDRLVPISTGSGKALYVGTYLPADGEYQRVKAILAKRYHGLDLDTGLAGARRSRPDPLFDEVAEAATRTCRATRRSARSARRTSPTYFGEDPVGYAAMTVRKVGRMWSSGVGEAMSSTARPGRSRSLLVALGLAGLVLLGLRRRWWELVALATPIVLVTAVGAVTLAAPRRNEVLMTLVFPLAALALSMRGIAAISSGREWSPEQASSPPN